MAPFLFLEDDLRYKVINFMGVEIIKYYDADLKFHNSIVRSLPRSWAPRSGVWVGGTCERPDCGRQFVVHILNRSKNPTYSPTRYCSKACIRWVEYHTNKERMRCMACKVRPRTDDYLCVHCWGFLYSGCLDKYAYTNEVDAADHMARLDNPSLYSCSICSRYHITTSGALVNEAYLDLASAIGVVYRAHIANIAGDTYGLDARRGDQKADRQDDPGTEEEAY